MLELSSALEVPKLLNMSYPWGNLGCKEQYADGCAIELKIVLMSLRHLSILKSSKNVAISLDLKNSELDIFFNAILITDCCKGDS